MLGERGKEITEAGGAVMEIVTEGDYGSLPDQEQLTTWVDGTDLSATTVTGANERVREVFPEREYSYVVDLSTMEVLWRGEWDIDEAIDKILSDCL